MKMNKFGRTLERSGIIILSAASEVAGRLLFPNYDINYLVYGARFYSEHGAPWMDVWPGLDIIHGALSVAIASPDLSIFLVGLAINILAALVIDQVFWLNQTDRVSRYCAVLCTLLFFKPPLGGWTSDHISFAVGTMACFVFILSSCKMRRLVFIVSGFSLGVGLLLKLNSFATSYVTSTAWMLVFLLAVHGYRKIEVDSIKRYILYFAAGLVIAIALMQVAVGFKIELYRSTIETYMIASQSTARGQFDFSRLALIPLQINLIDALRERQLGVLLFSLIIPLYWISIFRSSALFLKSARKHVRQRHLLALLFLLVSAFTALSLGRGLTHRVFLIPAGIILSYSDIHLPRTVRESLAILFSLYVAFVWSAFAYAQRGLERDRYYDSRNIIGSQHKGVALCIGVENTNKKGALVFTSFSNNKQYDKCWTSAEVKEDFGGFAHVEEIGNALGITFRNQEAMKGDYTEKWDWRKKLPSVRFKWSKDNAKWINDNHVGYFIERILVTPEEYDVPGYKDNIVPRQRQLELLVSITNAKKIGRLGRFTLWETKWARQRH